MQLHKNKNVCLKVTSTQVDEITLTSTHCAFIRFLQCSHDSSKFLFDQFRFELKAWQLSRHRIGQKIRKKVWDDMEVKGRSINGIQEIISVANYPMVPMDNQELDTLEEVMAERKLSKEVSKTAEFVTGAAPRLPKVVIMYVTIEPNTVCF